MLSFIIYIHLYHLVPPCSIASGSSYMSCLLSFKSLKPSIAPIVYVNHETTNRLRARARVRD